MNEDLGVWTSEDCALVLIDYQKEQLESIRSETGADLVAFHARWLIRAARAFGVPIVLSTVGVGHGFNSPTDPAIQAEMPEIEPIDRSSMDAFEDQAFRESVEATGRKRLIFGALQTEVCLALAVVEARKNGYDVLAVPWGSVRDAVQDLEWNEQVVIDATNDFDPSDRGGRTSSEVVADLVSPARVVKAANTLGAAVLASEPHEAGGRRVIFLSGDDADAKSSCDI